MIKRKNKVKKLCQSPQMEKYREKKTNEQVYNYIKTTWKKWITIILQYQKGEYFMETDYLTDNDFDNSPLIIIIPNEIINESDLNLNDITIGRKLDIEILGHRIKYRNEKVQIVGKIL